MDRSAQKKGNLTKKETNVRDSRLLTEELRFLQLIKRVAESPDGSVFVRKILTITNPMASPDGKQTVGFQLGVQSVGKKLVEWLTDAGINLKITDFVSGLNENRINEIEGKLNKLQTEDK